MSASLVNPLLAGRPSTAFRNSQSAHIALPEGTIVVSADDHWEINEDIFFRSFPKELREKAPRVWFDRYWRIGYPGVMEAAGISERVSKVSETSCGSGAWDSVLRQAHLAAEGISKEIVYPQTLLGFVRHSDVSVQEWIYHIYNEYIAARSVAEPGRFFGVGICSNWWDPARAGNAVEQIARLGLKAIMLPISPGKSADGHDISYGGPEMDSFWDAIADTRLPVTFHIGESIAIDGRGTFGASVFNSLDPFRKPFGQLIFGGVFDRYPDLQVIFAEGGISWIPAALQDAEMVFDTHHDNLEPLPKYRPSDYWHRNCYATFQNDLLGLAMLRWIGAGRVMWAADYPHNEGSLGYAGLSMQAVLDAVSDKDARQILGGTAIRVYGLP